LLDVPRVTDESYLFVPHVTDQAGCALGATQPRGGRTDGFYVDRRSSA